MIKWLPEFRRNATIGELAGALIVITFCTQAVTAIILGAAQPSFGEFAVQLFPSLMWSSAVLVGLLILRSHERVDAACALAIRCALAGGGVAVLAALTGWWTSASADSILRPGEAVRSILTLGLLPFHAGPSGLIRFLPAVFAFGIGREMSRRSASSRASARTVLWALGAYAVLSIALYALSWISGILAMAGKVALEAPRDAYNILVSAQVYGYWTMGQVERFAFSYSRQAENGLLLLHAALLAAGTSAFLLWTAVRRLHAVDALFKRLATRGVALFVIEICIGASLGAAVRGPRSTYTDAVALLVFLATACCWLAWWRFRRDLDCLARDERERPSLPLPSGAIAPHDLEDLCRVLLLLSLLGAYLLGWTSLIGVAFATAAMWTFSRSGEDPSAGVMTKSLNTTAVSLGLGYAGLGFGLREQAATPWMASVIISSALVIGMTQLFRHLRDVTTSRMALALGFTLATLIVLLCGGASVLGLLIVPFALGMLWVARSPGNWHRFGEYPFYIVLGFFAFFALFLPKMLFPTA